MFPTGRDDYRWLGCTRCRGSCGGTVPLRGSEWRVASVAAAFRDGSSRRHESPYSADESASSMLVWVWLHVTVVMLWASLWVAILAGVVRFCGVLSGPRTNGKILSVGQGFGCFRWGRGGALRFPQRPYCCWSGPRCRGRSVIRALDWCRLLTAREWRSGSGSWLVRTPQPEAIRVVRVSPSVTVLPAGLPESVAEEPVPAGSGAVHAV